MYFGHINNLDQDRKILPPALIRGLEYIKRTDFSRMKNGKYEIDGTKIYAMVQEYRTAPKDSRPLEAHVKYIDIQYVLEGTDVIGFGLPDAANEIEEDLSDQKDCIFFKNVKDEMELVLTPGMYAIFFPEEVHRPNCQYGVSEKLRKVVVKVGV